MRALVGVLGCLGAAFAGWTLYEQLTAGAPAFAVRIAVCVALFVAAGILLIHYALLATLFAAGLALLLAGAPGTNWLYVGIGAYLLVTALLGTWLVISGTRERAKYAPLVETLIAHGSRHAGEVTATQDTGKHGGDTQVTVEVTVSHSSGPTTLSRSFSVVHIPRVGDPVLVLRTPEHTALVFTGDRDHRDELRRQLKAAGAARL
ncbi:hypothetical protein LV75_003984 [Actinokineospora diospyrosa]|uniref:Uncharacterized protein n=1 Tax=Actinokineospora diospyrosa TaxID=103728 RepID=A0ABT1IFT0_9PSEU|nr:hypothetical protein [Actinokineospora diospyrosa]